MAVSKRKDLGREYPLQGTPAATNEDIKRVKDILSKYIDSEKIQ